MKNKTVKTSTTVTVKRIQSAGIQRFRKSDAIHLLRIAITGTQHLVNGNISQFSDLTCYGNGKSRVRVLQLTIRNL